MKESDKTERKFKSGRGCNMPIKKRRKYGKVIVGTKRTVRAAQN